MNFLDGALFPRSRQALRCRWAGERARADIPACIIAAASFVVARNGYQTDKQRIDEPKAIHASQGVFA